MALGAQAAALGELDRPNEAIEVYRRALSLSGEERLTSSLHGNLAVALGAVGRYAESVEEARAGLAAAQRAGDRVYERWNRLVIGRGLCSLGAWDEAVEELEPVRPDVPPFYAGMLAAPLVRIALGRGQDARVRELVDEYDVRCAGTDVGVSAADFRALRAAAVAALDGDDAALARVIPESVPGDYAEWSGWVAPVVDALLGAGGDAALAAARAALCGPGRMRRTPPVQAQAERLGAHLARRAGDEPSAQAAFERALALAEACGMRFEADVIARERAPAGAPRYARR
jgi:tetratricopeptide (TPR) repeat protein